MVQGVGLALAADLASQVHDPAGVRRRPGEHDIGGIVGRRVVDDEDSELVGGVVEAEESVDRGADDEALVPGGHDYGHVRREVRGATVVVLHRVERQHEELEGRVEDRQRANQHADEQEDGEGDLEPVHLAPGFPACSATAAAESRSRTRA